MAPGNQPTPSRRRQNSLILVKIWCLASPASKSDLPRRSRTPPKIHEIVPSTLLQPPVRSSMDSQSLIFRRFLIIYPCALIVSLLQTPATNNRIFKFYSNYADLNSVFHLNPKLPQTKPQRAAVNRKF